MERSRDLRTQGAAQRVFPGFSFCLRYLRLGVREAVSPETPMGADTHTYTPKRRLLFVARGPRKGHFGKAALKNITALLQTDTVENHVALPPSAKATWKAQTYAFTWM